MKREVEGAMGAFETRGGMAMEVEWPILRRHLHSKYEISYFLVRQPANAPS